MAKHYDANAVITVDEAGNYVAPGGGGNANPNGQATMANSAPVVIASDQSVIPVSVATVPTHAVTQSGTWTVTTTAGLYSSLTPTVTAATTNATVVKATPGVLMELTLTNPTATPIYVKVYNKATSPTVGTDVPVFICPVLASSIVVLSWDGGKRMNAGISYAVTGAMATSDTTAAVAGAIISGSYL